MSFDDVRMCSPGMADSKQIIIDNTGGVRMPTSQGQIVRRVKDHVISVSTGADDSCLYSKFNPISRTDIPGRS